MDAKYRIDATDEIYSPALVVFRDLVIRNIERMIKIAGDAGRLRPHCKTHKMEAVARLELQRGIAKHKCATFAEAEMIAEAGGKDVFLAYNLVGPSIGRAVRFLERYPDVQLLVTADDAQPLQELGQAVAAAGKTIGVVLDLDTGQHRTGLEPGGRAAEDLYGAICRTPGVIPSGFHVYDGQNHQTPLEERKAAVNAVWDQALALRDKLVAQGYPVPRLVAGGTGSFPIFAEKQDPALELSPGTIVFHDAGYAAIFPDLDFEPAALLLTRVVSRPTANRITLDLGNKAVAADPPMGRRLSFPDLPDAREVLHNEEHLVLESERAGQFRPGDELLAVPRHVCPTSALHKMAWVVAEGKIVDHWSVTARDRWIHV